MEFAVSYSGGKESALALYKTMQQGHKPIALITTFNTDAGRSHFHGLSEEMLLAVSNALDIPLMLIETTTGEYANDFEAALRKLKEEKGLKACVFGDIDIEGHKDWCSKRCENVGITPIFPLWGKSRDGVVYELIDLGFVASITIVDTNYLTDDFLGKKLTKEVLLDIEAKGADICGENGEYHTFVSNGPIFLHPVNFSFGEMASMGDYAMLKVQRNKYRACVLICNEEEGCECDFAVLIDEAASLTGVLHGLVAHEGIKQELCFVCGVIYDLSAAFRKGITLECDRLMRLEGFALRHKEEVNNRPNELVLPMGCHAATLAHVLRVKCKGLVRFLCKQKDKDKKPREVLSNLDDFSNLLSGYFYYLAFKLNALEGVSELPYEHNICSH